MIPPSPSSPEAPPPDRSIRLDHRVVLCPRTDGRVLASCECGWSCSAGSRQQAIDDLDTHLSVVIAMHEHGGRRPPETN